MSWYDAYLDMVEFERPEVTNELREPPFLDSVYEPWPGPADEQPDHLSPSASATPAGPPKERNR